MKINHLKNRIKQNKLKEYAGKHFVDENSEIISSFKKDGKKALLGIKRRDGVYTIIGEDYVYYNSNTGKEEKIPLSAFSNFLHENGLKKGKLFARYKYVKITNCNKIWLKNKSTMSALWNTVLWLEQENRVKQRSNGTD